MIQLASPPTIPTRLPDTILPPDFGRRATISLIVDDRAGVGEGVGGGVIYSGDGGVGKGTSVARGFGVEGFLVGAVVGDAAAVAVVDDGCVDEGADEADAVLIISTHARFCEGDFGEGRVLNVTCRRRLMKLDYAAIKFVRNKYAGMKRGLGLTARQQSQ